MQMVFQDPYSSLDPRSTVGDAVAEPLRTQRHAAARRSDGRAVVELLEHGRASARRTGAGTPTSSRAVSSSASRSHGRSPPTPSSSCCDEPVSSLDVSTQAEIINLLGDLQHELDISYLFIAHDLVGRAPRRATRIAVMYLGRIVETGATEVVYQHPRHPYTQALLSAIPVPDPVEQRTRKRIVLAGRPPVARQPAARLPLPHPVPVRDGRLPRGGSPGRPAARRGHGVLPPPSARRRQPQRRSGRHPRRGDGDGDGRPAERLPRRQLHRETS